MKALNAVYIAVCMCAAILFAVVFYIKHEQAHEKQAVAELGNVPLSVIEKSIQPVK